MVNAVKEERSFYLMNINWNGSAESEYILQYMQCTWLYYRFLQMAIMSELSMSQTGKMSAYTIHDTVGGGGGEGKECIHASCAQSQSYGSYDRLMVLWYCMQVLFYNKFMVEKPQHDTTRQLTKNIYHKIVLKMVILTLSSMHALNTFK